MIPSDDSTVEVTEVCLLPEVENQEAPESVGPACEKCGYPINSGETLVCRRCGWYASINAYVEIDQLWEAETDPALADSQSEQSEEPFSIPDWAWLMLACVSAVVVESLAVRYLVAAENPLRATWSVMQLFLGLAGLAIAHSLSFLFLVNQDSDVGLFDIFLRPLRPWVRMVQELPQRQWVCHVGASGFTAIIMSLLVIGALPYERLFDWGFKEPPKQNLMKAVMSQVQQGEGKAQSLEEAVQDLAGTQNLDGDGAGNEKAEVRHSEDCIILGYRTNDEGLVSLLILGGETGGSLRYVGQVRPTLPLAELRKMSRRLMEEQTLHPIVRVDMADVHWVKPKFPCRISYVDRTKSGILRDPKWEELLGEFELK